MTNTKLPEWMVEMIDQAGEHAFEVMVEQARINPEGMEALYGDFNDTYRH